MEVFSYLVIYIGLILGLAVAWIIQGFASLIRARDRVKWYWLHPTCGLAILLYTAAHWWNIIGWRYTATFDLFVYLYLLLVPCLFNLLAVLFFPQVDGQTIVDLREYYFGSRKWVFSVLAIIVLLDLADSYLSGVFAEYGYKESLPYIGVTVGLVALLFSAAATKNSCSRSPLP